MNKDDCHIHGERIPPELLGELQATEFAADDASHLRQRLEEDGYVFLRGLIPEEAVLAARDEVFGRLAEVGEIRTPVSEGLFTGTSRRRELCDDVGSFWKSVSEGTALRRVIHGSETKRAMSALLGEEAQPHDFVFLRPGVVGRATDLHYDHPFFARGSQRIHTVWTALRDIPVMDGPLMVVEGSHHFDDLIGQALAIDYESKDSPQVAITNAIELAQQRQTRLLTADFQPGDVIIFGMTTLHGALDNHSPEGRTRLSCDVRWQPASDPIDPRYAGPNPTGTTGAGYGELNGAKPLDVPWHVR